MSKIRKMKSYTRGYNKMTPGRRYTFEHSERMIGNVKHGDMFDVFRYKDANHMKAEPNNPIMVERIIAVTDAEEYKSDFVKNRWGYFTCQLV